MRHKRIAVVGEAGKRVVDEWLIECRFLTRDELSNTRRVIIDIPVDDFIHVYTEKSGDVHLLGSILRLPEEEK